MSYSDDEVKRLADLREWLVKQINDKEDELERLRMTLTVIDNTLKEVSFKPAVVLSHQATKEGDVTSEEVKPLTTKDNVLMANAYAASNSVTIIPAENMSFNIETPPFKSFFINRILQGMKNKDKERVESGELDEDQIISYNIEEDAGTIRKIVIGNYRDKERLNEIMNAASWTLARMLEKTR